MRLITFILTAVLLLSCSTKNMPDKDLEFYELNGRVNHLTIRHYLAVEKDGKIVKGEPDREGEVDQTITFNKDGYVSQAYFYGESDTLDTRLIRNYENGLCVGEVRYDDEDNILSEWVWLYDDRDNNVERVRILDDGTAFLAWKLYYDDNDELIARMSKRGPDSGLFDSLSWKLDKYDRQIEESSYGYYGYYGTNKVEYLDKTELPLKVYVYNGYDELSNILEMEYNDKGHLLSAKNFGPDTLLSASVTFEYEYDKKGNWIKRTQYYNGEPLKYEERRIIYY